MCAQYVQACGVRHRNHVRAENGIEFLKSYFFVVPKQDYVPGRLVIPEIAEAAVGK